MWDKNNLNNISSWWDKHERDSSSSLDVFKVIDRSYLEWLKKQAGSWIQEKQIDSIISHVNEHTTLTENDIKIIWWNLYLCGVSTSDSASTHIDIRRNKIHYLKDPDKLASFWYIDLFKSLTEFTTKVTGREFDTMWLDFSNAILNIPDSELRNTLSNLTNKNQQFLDDMRSFLRPASSKFIPFAVNNGKDVIYCVLDDEAGCSIRTYAYKVPHLPVPSKLES